ncbi:MBL fold metallo-hydrolase [Halostagnicola sp. A-GB9-2]|uniref:MBL fold metallo-hydrolase n=1 Tax=Halostagnicola sp. A-GB9-2 TaxID=3048066 RepID=UPI0024BFF5A9|nr:MBL fold metallo-hydrolase [Halostagnicola sp. A-GB9-2]MDJ1433805.1 MBL fold metallo-hydrolase [Halostagnicola sp. A-GB9-2]
MPRIDRGGTSQTISNGDETILIDCGPLTVLRLLESGIDPKTLEHLFFTHHHIDHNADFFEFLLGSWSYGRERLTVYGPSGTAEFLEGFYELYEEDIEYRKWFAASDDGIENINAVQTTEELSVSTDGVSITALPVEHSIETYAYRFEEPSTGKSCVISGDTRRIPELAEFASDADVLVQDCCIGPPADDSNESHQADEQRPSRDERMRKHKQNHCDPEDAGWLASTAGVDQLVLTHLLPDRDLAVLRSRAEDAFDGEVVVAEDGMEIDF